MKPSSLTRQFLDLKRIGHGYHRNRAGLSTRFCMGRSSRSNNLLLVLDSNYLVTGIIFKGLLPDVVFFISFSILSPSKRHSY